MIPHFFFDGSFHIKSKQERDISHPTSLDMIFLSTNGDKYSYQIVLIYGHQNFESRHPKFNFFFLARMAFEQVA